MYINVLPSASDFTPFDLDLASTLMTPASGPGAMTSLLNMRPNRPAYTVPHTDKSAPLLAYDTSPGVSPNVSTASATTFGPAFQAHGTLPDLLLITADNASFYAHRHILQYTSTNDFGGLLAGREESINVPETSTILSIALRVVYGLSCLHLTDIALESVESSINVLLKYGVPVQKFAAPHWPLFQLVLSHAPHRPIDAYALAAHHRLEELAVAVSAHLLAYDLSTLTDELTMKMGSIYVKRLFNLHQTRRNALKNIVMKPPAMHRPNLACGTAQQRQLTQAWAFAAAEMAWNVPPSMSTHMLQYAFERAGRDITCGECRVMLNNRIQEAMTEWSAVQRTI
ncbi:hypothetical protein C8T65DRAFT_699527 [Cerioporus squamosus]|nr:hypothetical protein C8T65DRAFT_699527 [Cerioporus squamosus]